MTDKPMVSVHRFNEWIGLTIRGEMSGQVFLSTFAASNLIRALEEAREDVECWAFDRSMLSPIAIDGAIANNGHVDTTAPLREPNEAEIVDAYRDAAARQARDGELEFDDKPLVSIGDEGAYVRAWIHVSDQDAGLENAADDE